VLPLLLPKFWCLPACIIIRVLAEKKKDRKKSKEGGTVAERQHSEDFAIAPVKKEATLDTSKWPLLLKVPRELNNLFC